MNQKHYTKDEALHVVKQLEEISKSLASDLDGIKHEYLQKLKDIKRDQRKKAEETSRKIESVQYGLDK